VHIRTEERVELARKRQGSEYSPSAKSVEERRIGYNYLCQFCVFYCFLGKFLPFESVKLNIIIKKSLSSENFCTPGEWALFAFVKIMGIR